MKKEKTSSVEDTTENGHPVGINRWKVKYRQSECLQAKLKTLLQNKNQLSYSGMQTSVLKAGILRDFSIKELLTN